VKRVQVISLAVACGCGGPSPARRPAAGIVADPNADVVALSANVPPLLTAEVGLIDAGSEPRQTLRYHPQTGHSQSVVIELATALTLVVGEMSPPEVRTPLVHVSMDIEPRVVDASGSMTLDGTLTRVDVRPGSAPPSVAAALAADLARLDQSRFSARVTSRGLIERLSFAAATDSSAQLATVATWICEALRLLLPPLPEEAVGRGAHWHARRRAQLGAAAASESAIYTLTTASETHLRLVVKLRLSAGAQSPAVAGLPPGATLKLNSLTGTGGGVIELDPARLEPHTDLRWSASALGSTQPAGEPPAAVRMVTTVELAIRPGGERPADARKAAIPAR
jgi:hypothetical protein